MVPVFQNWAANIVNSILKNKTLFIQFDLLIKINNLPLRKKSIIHKTVKYFKNLLFSYLIYNC